VVTISEKKDIKKTFIDAIERGMKRGETIKRIEDMIITKICNIAILQDLSPNQAYSLFIEQMKAIDSFLIEEYSLIKRKPHFISFINEKLLDLALRNIDLQFIHLIEASTSLLTLIESHDEKNVRLKALDRLIEITPNKKTLIPLLENLVISSTEDDIRLYSFTFLFKNSEKKIKQIIEHASINDNHLLSLIFKNKKLFNRKELKGILSYLSNPLHKLSFNPKTLRGFIDLSNFSYNYNNYKTDHLDYNNIEIRNGHPLDSPMMEEINKFKIKSLLEKNSNYLKETYLTICDYYCYDFSQKLTYKILKNDLIDSLRIMRAINLSCNDAIFYYYPKNNKVLFLTLGNGYIKIPLIHDYSKLEIKKRLKQNNSF
jgi:hypothetical protein